MRQVLVCGRNDEYNGVGLVEISETFATSDDFVDGIALFDPVCHSVQRQVIFKQESVCCVVPEVFSIIK